jgi:hypothetical protein
MDDEDDEEIDASMEDFDKFQNIIDDAMDDSLDEN